MRAPLLVALTCLVTLTFPASAADSRAIYRCEIDGIAVFSDRPCAPSAAQVDLDSAKMNTYEAPPIPTRAATPKPRTAARKESDPAAELQKHKDTCDRITQRLKDIRSKMRTGYKASEGERLKERQKRLSSQLRSARCR